MLSNVYFSNDLRIPVVPYADITYRKPEDIEAIDRSLDSLVFGDAKKGVTNPNFEASLTYSLQCSIGISGTINPSIPDWLLNSTIPLWVAIIGYLIYKEKKSRS